jgi:4-carboxymuconolactone decarboxylase
MTTILERPGLTPESRLLVAVAALAGLGALDWLKWHITAARQIGVPRAAIHEVLVQLVPYCGWATALNALQASRDVDPPEGSPAPSVPLPAREELRALGHENARRVNPRFENVAQGLASLDGEIVHYLTETAYGYVYGRPGLDLKSRELVAVALLAVLNQEPQLRYHIQGALNVGASRDEVREVLIQISLYAGWPASLRGLEILGEVR